MKRANAGKCGKRVPVSEEKANFDTHRLERLQSVAVPGDYMP